ncbi:MAG: [citrate (pro-3S)-lyase] ligase, partial [Fusicatenibacter saccharivorans]
MSDYMEETGDPFTGKKKEELKKFLEYMGLTYDEQITHSIVLRKEKEIIATASCQKNIIKCVAVSEAYQGQNLLAHLMTSLIEYFYGMGISHFFGFTKPQNKELFCSMGMYPVAQTEKILLLENDKNGLEKFLKRLKKETQEQQKCKVENRHENGIGAVVMNCNPFTRGHEYLIREAAKKNKWLHIFILSEEQSFLTTRERYQLVKEGIQEIPNVILHQTSEYMISPAVFPIYFIKEKAKAYEMNCQLDIQLFGERIAPELNITDRYVGSEPACDVTHTYNQCLREQLPCYQIRFHEI